MNGRPNLPTNPLEVIDILQGVQQIQGDFIAGPEPSNPYLAAIHRGYRRSCDSASNAPQWFVNMTAPSRMTMANLCGTYLAQEGSGPPIAEGPSQSEYLSGQDLSPYGGARIQNPAYASTKDVLKYEYWQENYQLGTNGYFVRTWDCAGGFTAKWTSGTGKSFIQILETGVCFPSDTPLPTPPIVPRPHPNPRPDPGLEPEDEPFEEPTGRPVIPMPKIENPWGDPIQLPNFPLPDLFGAGDSGDAGGNPNVGPPVREGAPIAGEGTNGEDDDFPEPDENEICVGFKLEINPQGVVNGLQANSNPYPIYRGSTGNYRARYTIGGDEVYSTPKPIEQQHSLFVLELPGLLLSGARVNMPANDSYVITPLYQLIEEEPIEQV